MNVAENSIVSNGVVVGGDAAALEAAAESLAEEAAEEFLSSAICDTLAAAVTATAAAQAGLNIAVDVVAESADVAAGISTFKAVRTARRFAELVQNSHADLARIGEALKHNPGRILAGVEKIIQSDLKLIAEKIPAREREAFAQRANSVVQDIFKDFKEGKGKFSDLMSKLGSDAQSFAKEAERKTEEIARKTEIDGVKTEVNGVKTEVNGVKTEVNGVKTEVNGLSNQVVDLKWDGRKLWAWGLGIGALLGVAFSEIWGSRESIGKGVAQALNDTRITMGAAFVNGRDFLTQRFFGSDLTKSNIKSPGLANVPVNEASLVSSNNPPKPPEVPFAEERLWWFDKADAYTNSLRPSGREFEVIWNDGHGNANALPAFAPQKMNGTILSVDAHNVVQDVGGRQTITYPVDALLHGLSGPERMEAVERLKKLEGKSVELKVDARGFQANSLSSLATQVLEGWAREGQADKLHYIERNSDGRVLLGTMNPGDRAITGKLQVEGNLVSFQQSRDQTRYFPIDELRKFAQDPDRLNAFLLRAHEKSEFVQIQMDGQGKLVPVEAGQSPHAAQLAQNQALGQHRA